MQQDAVQWNARPVRSLGADDAPAESGVIEDQSFGRTRWATSSDWLLATVQHFDRKSRHCPALMLARLSPKLFLPAGIPAYAMRHRSTYQVMPSLMILASDTSVGGAV